MEKNLKILFFLSIIFRFRRFNTNNNARKYVMYKNIFVKTFTEMDAKSGDTLTLSLNPPRNGFVASNGSISTTTSLRVA